MRVSIVTSGLLAFSAGMFAVADIARAAPACAAEATRAVGFTASDASDVLKVRATGGAGCANLRVRVTVTGQNADVILTHAVSRFALGLSATALTTPQDLSERVARIAAGAQLAPAATLLPAWQADAPGPGFSNGQELSTPLSRAAYDALRQSRAMVLCLPGKSDGGVCFTPNPNGGQAMTVLTTG